jgi:hypothetical protein
MLVMGARRSLRLTGIVFMALLALATQVQPTNAAPPKSPDRSTVRFTVRVVSGSDQSLPLTFDARYAATGSIAHFRVSLSKFSKLSVFSAGVVTLIAMPGSQPRAMLATLRRALEATRSPRRTTRTNRLSLDAVILGYNRATGWLTTKLFFGEDLGEVYLNLNRKLGLGEFSEKDPDYGNYVLSQLARVL